MLPASVLGKLDDLAQRHEELSMLLSDPEVVADRARYASFMREFSELVPVMNAFTDLKRKTADLAAAEELLDDEDHELRAIARTDAEELRPVLQQAEAELTRFLIPKDSDDGNNVFLEIRAGTGGDEAALFAGDLFRMYGRYAEQRGWGLESLSERPGEHGGYKEVIARVVGRDVFRHLKFESGAHRVQRVPQTESQGRIHTSACTVAVLPEQADIESVEIDPKDLRIDTFRASGAGGQHVNKTDSAVRLTHLPTGIVVECQDERSQHKNRARALAHLNAKLLDQARSERQAERAATRRNLVGSGDRSERIRTYNFSEGRVTDHRINLVLYRLDEILDGDLDVLVDPLTQEHQTDQLAALGDDSP